MKDDLDGVKCCAIGFYMFWKNNYFFIYSKYEIT